MQSWFIEWRFFEVIYWLTFHLYASIIITFELK